MGSERGQSQLEPFPEPSAIQSSLNRRLLVSLLALSPNHRGQIRLLAQGSLPEQLVCHPSHINTSQLPLGLRGKREGLNRGCHDTGFDTVRGTKRQVPL